ncbi:prospero homeobox protein 2 isoform X2 [Numida meleagris]|uniref:prospero homeobox protein 2 isoform X2 n=1 Tax=Numida meleagris TaxID=8996 RepID=UPI000B3D90AD|nr:prospero homeobox protein 2 isoform X2 [Numida meleagris]XP_021257766.1 prospero homeobox protein 2 isoform X2 [Numida meleagris]XP_021257767.1 prospero homeobox protein 2 isoform X2 [Numida meleagris]
MIPYQLQGGSLVLRQKEDAGDGRTAPEQDRECVTTRHSQGLKTEPCFQRDSLLPSPSSSLMSQLLSHVAVSRSLDSCTLFPSSAVELPQGYELGVPLKEAAQALAITRTHGSAPAPCAADGEQLSDEYLQAKRARVESIIQGMSLPPAHQASYMGMEGGLGQGKERGGEVPHQGKRKPRVPQQQGAGVAGKGASGRGSPHAAECQQLREQLCFLEQQLRWLQERFSQVCDSGDTAQIQEGAGKAQLLPGKAGDRVGRDGVATTHHPHKATLWESILEVDGPSVGEDDEDRGSAGVLPSVARVLSQSLKHELAGVTSRVVDSVLKTVWPKAASHLIQQNPEREPDAREEHFPDGKGRKLLAKALSPSTLGSPRPEAPSLSSGKSSQARSFSPGRVRNPHQAPRVGHRLGSAALAVQDSQLLGQLLVYTPCSHWGSPNAPERWPPEPPDARWEVTKLQPLAVRPLDPDMVEGNRTPLTPTHEALTPGHLKKAKLMFFFTRYPSSALLRSYFLDVQFSRCINSQLIKWFSNFREFYYIQVEKFARQALLEGVAEVAALRVSRDSELFRSLNMHYNKGNDFQVPSHFLEVASLTLQEFFSAVRAGRDADPSWKKPIYKIISKLDSHIPEVFKAVGCSQELPHN